jgi:hypothetical protein
MTQLPQEIKVALIKARIHDRELSEAIAILDRLYKAGREDEVVSVYKAKGKSDDLALKGIPTSVVKEAAGQVLYRARIELYDRELKQLPTAHLKALLTEPPKLESP